jgi:hypothetical protein
MDGAPFQWAAIFHKKKLIPKWRNWSGVLSLYHEPHCISRPLKYINFDTPAIDEGRIMCLFPLS